MHSFASLEPSPIHSRRPAGLRITAAQKFFREQVGSRLPIALSQPRMMLRTLAEPLS